MLSLFILFVLVIFFLFFFNDTAPTEIYTLSLHDALPISRGRLAGGERARHVIDADVRLRAELVDHVEHRDRKSTRLNSSHGSISYAVFCLKKKKKKKQKKDTKKNKKYTNH